MTKIGGSETTFDEMVDALADVQRRRLLLSLVNHNPQNDRPAVKASDEDAEAIEQLIAMRHVHLSKLAEYGSIDWHEETHEVTKGPNFDEIRPLLTLLATHEDELPSDWL